MKFIYDGVCRTVNGYMFWNGKPVDVTDSVTIGRLLRDQEFRRIEDALDEAPQRQEPEAAVTQADRHACPKCGRIVKQGKVLHQKHCKG